VEGKLQSNLHGDPVLRMPGGVLADQRQAWQPPLRAPAEGPGGPPKGYGMITAILGGGDWADASVNFVVLADGKTIEELHGQYREWYKTYECGQDRFYTFKEWLMKFAGAVEPTDDQLQIYEDGYWSMNRRSFFATLLAPLLPKDKPHHWAVPNPKTIASVVGLVEWKMTRAQELMSQMLAEEMYGLKTWQYRVEDYRLDQSAPFVPRYGRWEKRTIGAGRNS
jgi:hypothetical protein